MVIYKYTNLINGKVYIGKTEQRLPSQRHARHLSDARRGSRTAFHLAIAKYGIESFTYEIVDGANSASELKYKEIHCIHLFNSLAPNGYNLELGNKKHIQTRNKISTTNKKNVDMDKMKRLTESSKIKSCTKIKAVNCITNNTSIFPSIIEAAKSISGSYKYLGEILTGKKNYKAYKGFWFSYLDKPTIKKEKHVRTRSPKWIKSGKGRTKAIRNICKTTGRITEYKKIVDVIKDGFSKHTIKQYLRKTKNNCSLYHWEYM